MMKRLLVCFSTAAVVTAFAASSYRVTLLNQGTLSGKTLKPGDYKLELTDSSVVLKNNKDSTEAPAKVETSEKKFSTTTVRYDDQHQIQAICIGGTNKKVVIGPGSDSGTASKQSIR
jgi:hypothetical protein